MARLEDPCESSRSEALMEIPTCLPILEDGEVYIWRAWLDENAAAGMESAKSLSADELERASRFRHSLDCQRYVRAHVLLRSLLGSYLGVEPAKIAFTRGRFGKPALCLPTPEDGFNFSLSRSNGLAVCAVSRTFEVGVDVEYIQPRLESLNLAEQFLAKEDVSRLRDLALAQRAAAFFQGWTRMEASQKVSGSGLTPNTKCGQSEPKEISPLVSVSTENFSVGDGCFAAALALSGREYTARRILRHLNWSDA